MEQTQGERLKDWVQARPETGCEICRQAGVVGNTLSHMYRDRIWSQRVVNVLRQLGCPESILGTPMVQCRKCQRWVNPGKIVQDGKCGRCVPRNTASKIDGIDTRLALRDPWADGTFQGPYGVHVNDILVCPFR